MASTSVIGNVSSSSAASTAAQSSDRLASDKFTFLKLLVAQLENQDPLDPSDDQEFVAQLAQFTSLEQLQEINAGVSTLNTTMVEDRMMSATNFIGKAVEVVGDQITKTNDADGNVVTSYVYFTADSPFEKAYITIMDSTGTNIIATDTISGRPAGSYYYDSWDGKNANGKEVESGVYKIIIAGVDENDKSVLMETRFEAQVTSVYIEDGVYHLALNGGRSVALTDVVAVGGGATSTSTADNSTYAGLAADEAAKASLASDSAATYDNSITASSTASEAAGFAASAAKAAKTARDAADAAAEIVAEARKAAESAQTAAALEQYTQAKEWAEKADIYATAAEESATSAQGKADALEAAEDAVTP